jgi:hypothetical protein
VEGQFLISVTGLYKHYAGREVDDDDDYDYGDKHCMTFVSLQYYWS